MKNKIVTIDNDILCCQQLDRLLKKNGYESVFFADNKAGLDYLRKHSADIIFYNEQLLDMEEKDIISITNKICTNVDVIIITSHPNVRSAVNAIKRGALDYISKPFLPDEILILLASFFAKKDASVNNNYVHQTSEILDDSDHIDKVYVAGKSKEARQLQKQIELVASTNYSVIIYGESGTGKEFVAHSIHLNSPRRDKPFIAIDCGALTKELAASELFGHEKGAFTGALQIKIGQFELADKGTIFLDEITNLPYAIQISLLRVIQERKIRRIGSSREIIVDIRILVASNKKINEVAGTGEFREDLYHRFNEFSINLPPLRERTEDILSFAEFFLNNCKKELHKNVQGISVEAKNIFLKYSWPGNLREMNNIIRRAVLLCNTDLITPAVLPEEMVFQASMRSEPKKNDQGSNEQITRPALKSAALRAEYEKIVEVLQKVNYNKSTAALLLNIDRKTIYNKMRAFQMVEQ